MGIDDTNSFVGAQCGHRQSQHALATVPRTPARYRRDGCSGLGPEDIHAASVRVVGVSPGAPRCLQGICGADRRTAVRLLHAV